MNSKKIKLILIIVMILILVDQASKILVQNLLKDDKIIGNKDGISIVLTNNTGMALGFNEGNTKNIVITVFVLIIIITFIKNQLEQIDNKTSVAVSMVLAGGISNLLDRIIRGSVLDFIKIFKFPIFNVADIFVVIGWILIVLFLIVYSRKK